MAVVIALVAIPVVALVLGLVARMEQAVIRSSSATTSARSSRPAG
jgi:hypothetical protein